MLAVIHTFDGPEAIAYARCAVCGLEVWGTFDLNVVPLPSGEYEHDEETDQPCPRCGCRQLELDLGRDAAHDLEHGFTA